MNTFSFDECSFYFHTGFKGNIYNAKDVLFSAYAVTSVLMQATSFYLFVKIWFPYGTGLYRAN